VAAIAGADDGVVPGGDKVGEAVDGGAGWGWGLGEKAESEGEKDEEEESGVGHGVILQKWVVQLYGHVFCPGD
jgi:hypothetical protein